MSEKTEARSGSAAFEAVKWLLVVGFVAAAVVGNSYFSDQPTLYRVIGVVAVSLVAVFVALQTEQGKAFNQLRFRGKLGPVLRTSWIAIASLAYASV
jgi:preprotein translocase subunit SecE